MKSKKDPHPMRPRVSDTKKPKRHPRAPGPKKPKRRPRHRRKNPLSAAELDFIGFAMVLDAVDNMGAMATIMNLKEQLGVRRGVLAFLCNALSEGATIFTAERTPSPEHKSCQCGGMCPCHVIPILGGLTCPPTCPNFGNHFDGCHRCDCPKAEVTKC